MDALLRAAIERRKVEQGITASSLEQLQLADELRMRELEDAIWNARCAVCRCRLNECNTIGICNTRGKPECARERRLRLKQRQHARGG